jgi:hypothetical protein
VRDQVRVHLGADAGPETCTPHPAQHESESLQSTVQASVLMEGTSFRLSSAPAADCWRVKVKFASAPPLYYLLRRSVPVFSGSPVLLFETH